MSMELFGVRVDRVTLDEVIKLISGVVQEPRRLPLFIVTPNPEQIVQAQDDREFREVLNAADLAIADGFGLVWASVLLRKPPMERVSGAEVMERLIEIAAEKGWKVMLVGGRGDTAAKAADRLRIYEYTNLRIKGIRGVTDIKSPDKEEERRVIEEINEFNPDLLFVGYGAPWQEKWAYKRFKIHDSRFKIKCVMVVGGAIDQVVDGSLRPPRWMDRVGLGWLYRLVRQPARLGRQLRLVRFGWMVVRAALRGQH